MKIKDSLKFMLLPLIAGLTLVFLQQSCVSREPLDSYHQYVQLEDSSYAKGDTLILVNYYATENERLTNYRVLVEQPVFNEHFYTYGYRGVVKYAENCKSIPFYCKNNEVQQNSKYKQVRTYPISSHIKFTVPRVINFKNSGVIINQHHLKQKIT